MNIPRPEEVLSNLIKIDSVNPPGNELAVAIFLRDLFMSHGLEGEIIESSSGQGNFIIRLGEGKKKLLFLSHTDVVPPGEDWDFPPFSGEIKDGYVLGRGALDCKSLVAAQACALLQLSAEDPLPGTLIFAATGDEETGGQNGIGYLLEKHRDKIAADFAINEGAPEPCKIGNELVYLVQVGEKGTAWTYLTTHGVSCHGSLPGLGDNAVTKMAQALSALAAYKPEIKLLDAVQELFCEIGRMEGITSDISAENVDLLIENIKDHGIAEYLRSLTRMTLSPNVIRGGSKTNIVPDHCTAEVDIRVLPGQGPDYVISQLRQCLGAEIEIDIPCFEVPTFSPVDSDAYAIIENTIGQVVERAKILPCISTGATDSSWLRGAGIPAYGISVMSPDFDPSLNLTVHSRNERTDINSLHYMVKFLTQVARNYLM